MTDAFLLAINLQESEVVSPRKTSTRTTKARAARGRPRVYDERWVKVSVVLFERQVIDLDRMVNELRRASGRPTTRAALIRSFIDRSLKN